MPHAHVLSSSLVGGGSMNPDKLSLDLNFAADKTLTARKGPTPILTRGTNATYVGSDGLIKLTTGVHQARFDHDPITLACKGLLIEEGRTNLLWPSDTLTTQTRTVTAVAHTLSFYGTGTVVLSGTAIATVSGTGAYPTRTTLTFTPTAGSLILTVTGSVVFAQLEVGSFPTSYIPTTTGTAARSADVCSITDMGFYNQSSGTFFISGSRAPFALTGDYSNIVRIGDGTNNNRVGIGLSGNHTTSNTSLEIFYTAGGTSSINLQRNSSNSKFKGVIAYQSGDFAICLNGFTPLTTSTSTNIMSNVSNTVQFGSIKQIYIESIQFYKKRIANAKLQTLTA